MLDKAKGLYKKLCQDNWNANTAGIIVALFSILMLAWARPWGAVGAVRNWGEWLLYGCGLWDTLGFSDLKDAPAAFLTHTGSVIGIGFVGGAFVSACLGGDFAFRIPPKLEMIKGLVAGVFMGVGATLAGGCNVGGFYNAIGNLSAHGFAMMAGLIIGAIVGLKYVYWEMEHITWGTAGGSTIELPGPLKTLLGLVAVVALVGGAYGYGDGDIAKLSGILLIAAALGYTMQRARWCMIQGFREPHMTGDCELAKSVALSIAILAIGITIIKSRYIGFGTDETDIYWMHYVRGTFGWGGVVGGILFGFGAIQAGGCGTGTLWRVGEGQIKLWLVAVTFGISSAIGSLIVKLHNYEGMEEWYEEGITTASKLGRFVYMPDTWLGYGGTLLLILAVMAVWYIVVDWNEDSGKLTLEM